MLFADDFGCQTNMCRRRGWAPVGQRCHAKRPHGHWMNLTTVAALGPSGIVASLCSDGACDGEMFTTFCGEVLGPKLRRGQVVILDSLASHKVASAARVVGDSGAKLLFLPDAGQALHLPYSPDFNPIELAISKVKRELEDVAAREVPTLANAIGPALDGVSPAHASNFIRHCGYG